jgi:hypothetical protein
VGLGVDPGTGGGFLVGAGVGGAVGGGGGGEVGATTWTAPGDTSLSVAARSPVPDPLTASKRNVHEPAGSSVDTRYHTPDPGPDSAAPRPMVPTPGIVTVIEPGSHPAFDV